MTRTSFVALNVTCVQLLEFVTNVPSVKISFCVPLVNPKRFSYTLCSKSTTQSLPLPLPLPLLRYVHDFNSFSDPITFLTFCLQTQSMAGCRCSGASCIRRSWIPWRDARSRGSADNGNTSPINFRCSSRNYRCCHCLYWSTYHASSTGRVDGSYRITHHFRIHQW